MSSREVQKLGERIAELEETLNEFLQHGVGLGHSSFEGQINQYDGGSVGSSFGRQYDGTNGIVALTGPPPPTPSFTEKWGPTAEGVVGGLRVRWEGYFEPNDVIVAPMDFKGVEVYVSDQSTPGFSFQNLKTTITSARGGEVLIPMPVFADGYYVWLVARSTTGRASGFSEVIGPFHPQKVREEDLGFDIGALAGTQIFWGDVAPTTDQLGDLWLKLPEEAAYRYAPSGWQLTADQVSVVAAMKEAIGDKLETDGQATLSTGDALALVASARDIANAAQAAADAASGDAAAASGLAQTAKNTADGKITVYRQDDPPSGGTYGLNDLWIDTNANNQLFAWNGAWIAVDDQRIATALSTANGKTTVFAQDNAPATTGRTTGDIWVDTNDGNKQYVWNGAWTARTFGAAAISATARQLGAITTYRQSTAPSSGMIVGDFWIDSDDNKLYRYEGATPTWVAVQDVAIQTAVTNAATAQATADGKMRTFIQPGMPTGLVAGDIGDIWIDTDDDNVTHSWDGAQWVKRQISNGAIEPNSLVASDIIATGTITAALLEAIMVLANTIVAGNPAGTHTKITPTGIYVYSDDPVDSVPNEVIRMGTDTNDFFGITGSDGMLKLSLDDTGSVNARTGNFREDITIQGRALTAIIEEDTATAVGYFNGFAPGIGPGGNYGPIRSRVGIAEANAYLRPGRRYRISYTLTWMSNIGDVESRQIFTYSGPDAPGSDTAPTPTINSTWLSSALVTAVAGATWMTSSSSTTFVPTTEGRHRFLLNIEKGAGVDTDLYVISANPVTIWIEDTGPARPSTGSLTQGGGQMYQGPPPPPPPPPTQQYYVDLGVAGRASYRGNGSQMIGYGNDVYQGYESSNGDTRGQFWFDLPNITGTVDRVDVYLYFRHWWYNSGGTVIMNISDHRGLGPTPYKFKGDWHTGGWPKPGSKTVTVPSDWWPLFRGTNNDNYNGRATVITLGPGGGTNQTYYGVATDCRLRIWYTQ